MAMDKVAVSLRKRHRTQMGLVLVAVYILLAIIFLLATKEQIERDNQADLAVRHFTVSQALHGFLLSAEYELGSTAQVLLNNRSQTDLDLGRLFDRHDEFLFGSLDFFYVEWAGKNHILDPRTHLFTQDSIERLIAKSKLGRWTLQQTKDGASLLIYKKKIVTLEGDWKGYLYGFISLNNNLTLANRLLKSAQIDEVRLLSPEQDIILSERQLFLPENLSLDFYRAELQIVKEGLAFDLQIAKQGSGENSVWQRYLYWMTFFTIGLSLLYFILVQLSQRLFNHALHMFELGLDSDSESEFIELRHLQRKMNDKNELVSNQLSRFNLLMDASQAAIIFCDDIALVQNINHKASALFSESSRGRTVFDFMPVACHQALQKALKGEVGIEFELTVPNVNSIYQWQLIPYMTDSHYRGVALIGHDVTHLQQLEWQLNELKVENYGPSSAVEINLILNEINHQIVYFDNKAFAEARCWQQALIACLSELLKEPSVMEQMPLGELLQQRLVLTPSDLGRFGYLNIECSLSSALIQSRWSSDLGLLINALIMSVHASELIEEKRLSICVTDNQLRFEVVGISDTRPIFTWLNKTICGRLGIEIKQVKTNQASIIYPLLESSLGRISLPDDIKVAWLANDYAMASHVEMVLKKLGCSVHVFSSAESFFTEVGSTDEIDLLLIAYDVLQPEWRELPAILQTRLARQRIPVAWIGNQSRHDIDGYPNFSACAHEYSLARFIEPILSLESITLQDCLADDGAWLVVGGSSISRAILYEELSQLKISPYLVPSLEGHLSLFKHNKVKAVLLLDDVENEHIVWLGREQPDLMLVSLSSAPSSGVIQYQMKKPYRKEQVKSLVEFVQHKIALFEE
ncbi:hypothetical protein A9Q77_11640 [Marinomonas sp. 42_23_T18]|nr:hypothetical protein A9Q77_11640 [Marinomonas sp. 42_23_T18]